jgi:pSer/pThr/pTyr-binding forkhead associated (FHA) protein
MALRFVAVATGGTVVGVRVEEVIDRDSVVIGRDEGVDLVLPEPTVSRRHAEVRGVGGGWEIEDLGSRLGTWLNGKKLKAGVGVPLRVGDEVEVGIMRIQFLGEEETREMAGELAAGLKMAGEGRGAGMLAAVIGLAVGMLSLLAALLL